jgi:hypothetical protein
MIRVLHLVLILLATVTSGASTATKGTQSLAGMGCGTLPGTFTIPELTDAHYDSALSATPLTNVPIMPARYVDLQSTVTGYMHSGVPLVRERSSLWQPPPPDDIGIYYFIPKLVSATGWSLQRATDTFFISLLVLGLTGALAGWWLCFESSLARVIAVGVLSVLSAVAYAGGDVYIVAFSVVVIVVPWALYLRRRKTPAITGTVAFTLGMLVSTADYIRSQSGTAALIFATIIFAYFPMRHRKEKLILVSCLLAGVVGPWLLFRSAVNRRNAFLSKVCPQYGHEMNYEHPFWHSVYIGLGFLQNDPVHLSATNTIHYRDEVAFAKVEEIAPGTPYFSKNYEHILRHETLGILVHHPAFVLASLAAKSGVILLAIIISANVGLVAAYTCRKPWPIDIAFWLSIAFSALPGLLVMPTPRYLLGLIALSVSYSIASLGFVVEQRRELGHLLLAQERQVHQTSWLSERQPNCEEAQK